MSEWKELLFDIDDDYLVGLSNKGIVKRARKDMEGEPAKIVSVGGEAVVETGGETVTVKIPLGESRCSCPSRTVCRHVVRAILELKKSVLEADVRDPELSGSDEKSRNVLEEISAYPLASIKKRMGVRRIQDVLRQAGEGSRPKITVSSIVTVRFPDGETVVKLLSPLDSSTCTCHKKEICGHKAAAILWCQLETGTVTLNELEKCTESDPDYDFNGIWEAARQMKAWLEAFMGAGLARMSPEAPEEAERLAVISHNAGLAKFEGYFRAFSDSCKRYQDRVASFRTRNFMEEFSVLYQRVLLLCEAETAGEIAAYAGEFRSEYVPAGELDLIGVASEHFKSKTGYEGETYYFLEEHGHEWYTYTNARPVFYEQSKGRRENGRPQAPWGLNVSLEELDHIRLHLTGAKVNGQRRISSGTFGRGEVTGQRNLTVSEIKEWHYRDFGRLLRERGERLQREWFFDPAKEDGNLSQLVILEAENCGEAVFDEAQQTFRLPLLDARGREILIEMAYSKEDAAAIRYLERLAGRILEKDRELPYFAGKVWLRDGRLKITPVACLEKKEIKA